jgi:Ca2+-binding RTX toxin-like protein
LQFDHGKGQPLKHGTVVIPGPAIPRASRALRRAGIETRLLDVGPPDRPASDLGVRLVKATRGLDSGPIAWLGRGVYGEAGLWAASGTDPAARAVAALSPRPDVVHRLPGEIRIPALLLLAEAEEVVEQHPTLGGAVGVRFLKGSEAERVAARWLAEQLGVNRRLLPALAGAAVLGAVIVSPMSAGATVTSSYSAGNLTVTSDGASDRIEITCGPAGNVRVNGTSPSGGPVDCGNVVDVTVAGGGGSDTVDLRAMDAGDFTGLISLRVEGGTGNDRILGAPIPTDGTTLGDDGRDTVLCGLGCDCVIGGDGNDSLVGGSGPDDFSAGLGNDTVKAGGGADDYLYGESGNDLLLGGSGDDQFFSGGNDNDTVSGGSGDDLNVGGDDGNDTVSGEGGSDQVLGDTVGPFTHPGDDLVSGGLAAGDTDTVTSGGGTDTLVERADVNMRLESNVGATLTGGGGTVVINDPAPERIRLYGGPGSKTIDASGYDHGGVTLLGLGGSDALIGTGKRDQLIGGPGNDVAMGGDGRDLEYGGRGDDRLLGQGSSDTLRGDPGNDTLRGGPGRDNLDGGPGQDVEIQ